MSLVQMTLTGGVFILFIVVVRSLALHRLPKEAFTALWKTAALRLLLPFTISLPISVLTPVNYLPTAGVYTSLGRVVPVTAPPVTTPSAPSVSSDKILYIIWLVGAVLTAAYFTVSCVRIGRRFRVSSPDDTPAVRSWLADQKLRRPIEVRRSPSVSSPLTYGVLRPVILLPEETERNDQTTLTYILTHELIHIRRFDGVTKLIFAAVLCVHWFNPLVWVMFFLANRDLELSCDERVMDILGSSERASYALTLIDLEETRSRCFSPYNHFSKLAIKERIEAIMKYKKASVLAIIMAVALVAGATTVFAVTAQAGSSAHLTAGKDLLPNSETLSEDSVLLFSGDKDDGKVYYSPDNGKTFVPLEEENVLWAQVIEWWTYDEYAAWLENEKTELQAMLGEKGWTGGRGEFVWTQEIIDETIAMYEKILQEIKDGMLYSKSVDGNDSVLISCNPSYTVTIDMKDTYMSEGYVGLEEGLAFSRSDCTEEEWQQIIADIESGKISPYIIPDDPNITVSFADYGN